MCLEEAIKGVKALGFAGLNVTIPHKVSVLGYLDALDRSAVYLGNVNTVVNRDGRLVGYNTDGIGISDSLVENGIDSEGRNILCEGAGGVAQTVVLQLLKAKAERVCIANRSIGSASALKELASVKCGRPDGIVAVPMFDEAKSSFSPRYIEEVVKADIIIQTTSVGMYPNAADLPTVPVRYMNPRQTVFELVYNPINTRLLREARAIGCKTIDGTALLINQGAAAFELWTERSAPIKIMRDVVLRNLLD
jgi:shikimate dehydrogenase